MNQINLAKVYVFLSILLLVSLSGCGGKSAAETPPVVPTRDPNLEHSIEQQLQQMNSAAIPVYREATKALDQGDYEESKKLYEQVIALAPEFSTAYRRLGYIESGLDHVDRAEELTRKALALEPNSYNQSSLAMILLQKDTSADSQEAFDLATSATQSLPDDSQALMALMMSSAALNNFDVLRTANNHLLEVEPTNPVAHYYAGLIAATDQKWEKAESELLISQEFGIPPDAVQKALDSGIARYALMVRFLRWGSISTVLWLIGLGILFVAGISLSQATMQTLRSSGPIMDFQVQPKEQRIRSVYRFVIAILSLYFYISLPFTVLLLLLVVGGAFYVFFAIGSIPIQFALILGIMLITSLIAIVRSIFSRRKDVPPGRPLLGNEAPELWALVADVARRLEVRPVDTIYLTPWIGIAVYETGSILQKLRGSGKRNLILGMGALTGLTQGQLAAILAHEYGHFSNRDTAGGDLAHQVYASLHHIAQQLIQSRATQIFNPVWLFVLGYQRIFLRVTLGASRLQEILADRYAALTYGTQNFIDGLQRVTRQAIAFPMQADYEVRRSFELNRPISNLFDLDMPEKLQGEIEKQVEEIMERPTSAYDSHPAFKERIAWIDRLYIHYSAIQDNRVEALRLFPNPEALQRELTSQLLKNVRKPPSHR